jgi:transposase
MDVHACLPDPKALTLLGTTVGQTVVWLDVESRARSTPCPQCGTLSTRKHSRYVRTLKDVPLLGHRVRWRLKVHKYFCDVQGCPQRVFCERLPEVMAPWRRATLRLETQQRLVALEAGAESALRRFSPGSDKSHRPRHPVLSGGWALTTGPGAKGNATAPSLSIWTDTKSSICSQIESPTPWWPG